MSRARKAAASAAFTYINYGVAIVTGIFLVPLTLHSIGARHWGLWLAATEVLNYGGMLDLGVLSVLPWLFAESYGRRDRTAMRRLVSHGFWLGVLVAAFVFVVMVAAWRVLPSRLFMTADDVAAVGPPLALMVIISTVASPLGVFRAVLESIQDVSFVGTAVIVQSLFGVALTAVLLLEGFGLYALALASALPSFVTLTVYVIRVRRIAPDLRPQWLAPTRAEMRPLLSNGFGSWLSNIGWQILAASTGIVITYLGNPGWVAVYACTSKLSGMTMHLSWALPDSGHIALSQLYGERKSPQRLREVVYMMLQLHLLIAGAAAIGLLVFNPPFVVWWVGITMFYGVRLNALLAAGVLLLSIIHSLITSAAVLGRRLAVGWVVLVNGLLQVPLAIVLGHRYGLSGVGMATLIAGALTALPAGIWLLRDSTQITLGALVRDVMLPWLPRFVPVAALAFAGGMVYQRLNVWIAGVCAAALCLAYAWLMRPLYASLPLDQRVTEWLVRFRLIPPPGMMPAIATTPASIDESLS